MTVRGVRVNPDTGQQEVVHLDDSDAAAQFTSGAVGFLPDQLVPIRHADGTIHRYKSADVSAALAQPGYSLDFVEGNRQRAAMLRSEQEQGVFQDTFGALASVAEPVANFATQTTNTALLGLPGLAQAESQRQAEDQASSVPDAALVDRYVQQGMPYDDALLLATGSYNTPGYVERMGDRSPVTSAAGTITGIVAPAFATMGASLAAEVPIAGAVATRLGTAGLGEGLAQAGGRAVASGIVGTAESVAQTAVQRVGEGVILGRPPEFTGTDLFVNGILAPVVGSLGSLGVDAFGALGRRSLAALADLSDSAIASRAASIDLRVPIREQFAPDSPPGWFTNARVRANASFGKIDESANRRLTGNAAYRGMSDTTDDVFASDVRRAAQQADHFDEVARAVEADQGLAYRNNYAAASTEHIAQAAPADVVVSWRRLRDLSEGLSNGIEFDGLTSATANRMRAVGKQLRGLLPEDLWIQVEELGRKSVGPPGTTWRDAVDVSELADVQQRMRGALAEAARVMPNIQSNLFDVARSVGGKEELLLGQVAAKRLSELDGLLSDPTLFGPGAAQATSGLEPYRRLMLSREEVLKELGKTSLDADSIASERAFSSARIRNMAQGMRPEDSEAALTKVNQFLDSLAAADPSRQADIDAFRNQLGTKVVAPGAARRDMQLLITERNRGSSNPAQVLAAGAVYSALGGPLGVGAAGAAAGAVRLGMRPDDLVKVLLIMDRVKASIGGKFSAASGAVTRRLNQANPDLALTARAARSVILPNPDFYNPEKRDAAFDSLVGQVREFSDNPTLGATRLEEAGFDVNTPAGSEAVSTLTQALMYLQQQMPSTVFDPLNPTPPSRRVSSMTRSHILQTYEALQDPLCIYHDFGAGCYLSARVNAVRNVFPELYRSMNAQVLSDYSDRLASGATVPYGTRLQLSMLLGTPIEQALKQPYLMALQNRSAQTPQQAQAQGMGRQPARAVTSITNSTTTEGASLQDNE